MILMPYYGNFSSVFLLGIVRVKIVLPVSLGSCFDKEFTYFYRRNILVLKITGCLE